MSAICQQNHLIYCYTHGLLWSQEQQHLFWAVVSSWTLFAVRHCHDLKGVFKGTAKRMDPLTQNTKRILVFLINIKIIQIYVIRPHWSYINLITKKKQTNKKKNTKKNTLRHSLCSVRHFYCSPASLHWLEATKNKRLASVCILYRGCKSTWTSSRRNGRNRRCAITVQYNSKALI